MGVEWPDLSEFQSNADIAGIRKQTDVIAVRVSYGTRLDKCMPARLDEVRGQNFVCALFYLFLRASQDVTAQVNTVSGLLGDLRNGESIVIDYEADAGSMPSVAQRDEAASLFEQIYHKPTLLYMSSSMAVQHPTTRPLWVAAYGKYEPSVSHVIWQHTDAGGPWAGCGLCDSNVYSGNAAELIEALGSAQNVAAQFGPIQTHGDDMNSQQITTLALDDQGNGYIDTHISVDKFVTVAPLGGSPDRDGGYHSPDWPDYSWKWNDTNGQARIVIRNGTPHKAVSFVAWSVE